MVLVAVGILWLTARQSSALVWLVSLLIFNAVVWQFDIGGALFKTSLVVALAISAFLAIKPLRRRLISRRLMQAMRKAIPEMSSTEREALEAGTISWEGDLFTGVPDYQKLLQSPVVAFTADEQAFIDGPVTTLCRMIDDWDITHNRVDLPAEIWDFIAKHKFWGMIIPREYGGLDFSASAQVAILVKIYSRSISLATTISVPNSLGPAELLLKYGTPEQRDYYLPRLAQGLEIPCFALTGPDAGSDAASIPDHGVVCKQTVDGKEIVGVRLNWNKRYITLAPVATVIGLAFRLFDPDNLLGRGEDIGISCALIPAETKGVRTGRRHFPLNAAFMNGPTQGKDVFIPLSALIGGEKMAGQGWRMLMECLSAGRAISLPASASAGGQLAALSCGAYARVRRQFNQSISQFEGIEEPLARIAAKSYIIDAGLTMAAADIDHGAKPAVAGAILKYHTTELARQIGMDAMDIHGGKGICLGPSNYLGRGYQNSPISITVEGANILTRSLIIFGQGVVRCHPYVFAEMESIRQQDLLAFDQAFWRHSAFIMANFVRSLLFGFSDGYGSAVPESRMRRQFQRLNRYSANLAFLSDYAMALIGGELKRREKISARLGDLLSKLYLISAVLKRFHDEGEPKADEPIVLWACEQLFYESEEAIANIIANFPGRMARVFLKGILLPLGRRRSLPSDKLGHQVATLLTRPNEARDRLTRFVFKEAIDNCPVGILESGFLNICAVAELEHRLTKAWKKGDLKELTALQRIEEALSKGMVNAQEAIQLREAEEARQRIIAVDDFDQAQLQRMPPLNTQSAPDSTEAPKTVKRKADRTAETMPE
ncbi:MAG: acyl-CoA dehydrogenase [Legionellaceae bacterium]|nr:acyl-CoA dehydrogenase [Legionellaceae bacterium]